MASSVYCSLAPLKSPFDTFVVLQVLRNPKDSRRKQVGVFRIISLPRQKRQTFFWQGKKGKKNGGSLSSRKAKQRQLVSNLLHYPQFLGAECEPGAAPATGSRFPQSDALEVRAASKSEPRKNAREEGKKRRRSRGVKPTWEEKLWAQTGPFMSSSDIENIKLIAGCGSAVRSSSFSDGCLNQGGLGWGWRGLVKGEKERKIPGQIPWDYSWGQGGKNPAGSVLGKALGYFHNFHNLDHHEDFFFSNFLPNLNLISNPKWQGLWGRKAPAVRNIFFLPHSGLIEWRTKASCESHWWLANLSY